MERNDEVIVIKEWTK